LSFIRLSAAPKIYITSDWHLAEGAWTARPEIAGDAFESLRRLTEIVRPEDIILAAGDLIDVKRPSSTTVNSAKSLLEGVGASVYFIQGQHERDKTPWLNIVDAVHLNETSVYTQGKNRVALYGLDWGLSLNLQARLDAIGELAVKNTMLYGDNYNILVLHQTCNAVLADTDENRLKTLEQLSYRDCELKDGMLPRGFNLVVVGYLLH
jgi:DNA repair exonuclease SbcCD nuclease subunit